MNTYTATTLLRYSPRKARLIINEIRGKRLSTALSTLQFLPKGRSKDIYKLLKSAASNLQITDAEYSNYIIKEIVAEQNQILKRVMPRAQGRAFRLRKPYTKIKVLLLPN